jgi:hypothetical protein
VGQQATAPSGEDGAECRRPEPGKAYDLFVMSR